MSNPIIASFDIGIKNMAYCVLELEEQNANTICKNILVWGIIDMMPETKMTLPTNCEWCNCNNISSFIRDGKKYCKKHIDKKKVINIKEFNSLKKKTIALLRDFCVKYSIDTIDFTQKKIKKTELLDNINKVICSNFYIPISAAAADNQKCKNAKEIDLITIGREMTKQLDIIFCGGDGDGGLINKLTHVFIENQISTIAVRMKTLQGMLTQYFILKGNPNTIIKYISASKKLDGVREEQGEGKRKKTTYNERKKQSIELCANILRENEKIKIWGDFFNTYRTKKDDLADAFLQGLIGGANALNDIKK